MISGIYTAVLLILFIGIVLWAWSGKRKEQFDHMSKMPLDEKEKVNETKGEHNGHE